MDTTANGLISRLAAWAATPITEQMDLVDVALTVAFATTIVVAWLFVMRHIVPQIEE